VLLNKVGCRANCCRAPRSSSSSAVAGTGTDNIDMAAARSWEWQYAMCAATAPRRWYNTPGDLILSLTQHCPSTRGWSAKGSWARTSCSHRKVPGPSASSTAASWGSSVGASWAAAWRASRQAFGMRIVIAEPPRRSPRAGRVERLMSLLAVGDIVSLHCPLTDSTRGLIGAANSRS
jgi:glycerate dehydrogenase